jgi:hypothetical protein
MVALITFVFGLVSEVGSALQNGASSGAGQYAISQIVTTLPTDLGTMLVAFINGLHGIMPALANMFSA